jgi:septal ring factor EnvC (AmiA/AmiB activator)
MKNERQSEGNTTTNITVSIDAWVAEVWHKIVLREQGTHGKVFSDMLYWANNSGIKLIFSSQPDAILPALMADKRKLEDDIRLKREELSALNIKLHQLISEAHKTRSKIRQDKNHTKLFNIRVDQQTLMEWQDTAAKYPEQSKSAILMELMDEYYSTGGPMPKASQPPKQPHKTKRVTQKQEPLTKEQKEAHNSLKRQLIELQKLTKGKNKKPR